MPSHAGDGVLYDWDNHPSANSPTAEAPPDDQVDHRVYGIWISTSVEMVYVGISSGRMVGVDCIVQDADSRDRMSMPYK